MGAFQARIAAFAFVGLSVFVAYNAVYLQSGPHPAPFASDVKTLNMGSPADTKSLTRRRPVGRPPGAQPTPSSVSETVRAVQRELAARGYEPGPADGVLGLLTRAAVMAYQHDKELPVTGEASDGLLRHILLGAHGRDKRSKDKLAPPAETVALIKAVQQILAKMGYDPGPVDGVMGPSTRRAIRTFEQEQKLTEKGRISGALLKALVRVTGARLANIPAG